MKKRILGLMIPALLTAKASAQVLKIDLQKDLSFSVVNLYVPGVDKAKTPLSPLARLKDYEIHLKWAECATQAAKVFPTQREVRGWIATSWLNCLEQGLKKKSPVAVSGALNPALTAIQAHKDIFNSSHPWGTDLSRRWVGLKMMVLEEQAQKKVAKTENAIEELLDGPHALSRDQKATLYRLLGDLAQNNVDYKKARFFYEQAQDQKDSKYLQERLDFLIKAAGDSPVPTAGAETPPDIGEETKIEERIRQAVRKNELIAAIQDSVLVLNQYPGSRAARRLKDRPLEIYNQISDSAAKARALTAMQEADAIRLLEWAQNLHRRADYPGALALAEQAFEKNANSPQSTSMLWIMSRSAHFTGQYDKALEYYNKLIVQHAGSDEAAEALFRSALVHFRKKDYSSAAALLERLLTQNRDRYDLNGRYWLVRSLQEAKSDRAVKEAGDVIQRYPFSYYGLRLRAEASGQKLSWPEMSEKPPELEKEFYLVGPQKSAWRRYKTLAAAGWVSEAHAELASLPFIKDPTVKVSLAEKLARQNQFMTAIRLINDALENDPRLRREQFVKIGYPPVFAPWFETEGQRYGLSPILLRSLTRQESGFNLRAVSTSNALGLMQMIPPTAEEVSRKLGLKLELPDDMFRPEVNIPMGSFYLNQMLDQFQGSVPVALAAYNAGPTRVKIWLESRADLASVLSSPGGSAHDEVWFDELPWNETSFYVKAILRNVLLYRLAQEGSFTLKPVLWQDLINKKAK